MAEFSNRTFLITGVSSGLGSAFAAGALAAGHRVIGTVRRPEDAAAFEAQAPGRAHALELDVTSFDAIPARIAAETGRRGPIDVLVNNAGIGHEGVLEESSIDDLKRQFDANVFGAVAMIKAVLPGMRERRRGHIVNVTSMGGFITMPLSQTRKVAHAIGACMEPMPQPNSRDAKPGSKSAPAAATRSGAEPDAAQCGRERRRGLRQSLDIGRESFAPGNLSTSQAAILNSSTMNSA
jgi:NAD(P)-dependent dehydrogenase (short-subunit alcohol dehydrogenase family)